jgi:hypothetical protein
VFVGDVGLQKDLGMEKKQIIAIKPLDSPRRWGRERSGRPKTFTKK